VTSHDTFGYFARRYGFEVIGSVQGLSTEEGEPSAREIAQLAATIREAGIPVIFAESVSNPGLVESVAAEAGVTLGPPLYTDSLGPAGSDGATYDVMMRHNVTAIVEALGA
jgi:ABC-type Zn uptake system ZnuABC Zn-binding protein ZnuA